MEKRSGVERVESAEGGLKELVLRWFTETQAPLILHNGSFPDWFQGLAARKDAEDLLRDKAPGCFLIRLSDRAVGYILSYKGHDRCRHFVITQNQDGRFVISGDCETYGSLSELIEHYKVSPVQPFGEYLTSSCYEDAPGELYDVVHHNRTSGVSVRALRTLWNHRHDPHSDVGDQQRTQQQEDAPAAPPPALPPKSKTRKLMGTVSVDAVSLPQAVPPVPKRGVPLGLSLSGSLTDTSCPGEPQRESSRAERLRRNTKLPSDTSYPGDLCPPAATGSELPQAEGRSQSLPRLDNSSMAAEEEYSNQLSSPSFTPAPPLKRVTCQTYSLHVPREGLRPSSSRSESLGNNGGTLRSNPLYQSSEGASPAQQGDGMYAEVPQSLTPAGLPNNTYEQISGEPTTVQGNTYESLEDMKTKKSKSTWGKNNITWKKFLPDYKKK